MNIYGILELVYVSSLKDSFNQNFMFNNFLLFCSEATFPKGKNYNKMLNIFLFKIFQFWNFIDLLVVFILFNAIKRACIYMYVQEKLHN